jgi:hypothetical protein
MTRKHRKNRSDIVTGTEEHDRKAQKKDTKVNKEEN